MNESNISVLLLERYHIGEVTPEEKLRVERAIENDKTLADALANLDRGDRDFMRKYPIETFFPDGKIAHNDTRRMNVRTRRIKPIVWGLCAAALVLIAAVPLFILKKPFQAETGDRMKGVPSEENFIELSVYLKGDSAGDDFKLPDHAGVSAGNVIQLAYHLQTEDAGERYGVIFSIDGRSSVTMHYPYMAGQSTLLVSGRITPLDEAYKLDDAPDYEIFFFVIGKKPVEVTSVLNTARHLAPQIAENPQEALDSASAVFKDYELKTLTLWKE